MNIKLIEYLIRQNKEFVLKHSLQNCHVEGVDSLFLIDEEGLRLRMFIATPNHALWTNSIYNSDIMSVAFHPHHCDIRIEVVKGLVANVFVEIFNSLDRNTTIVKQFDSWLYQSKVTGNKAKFVKQEPVYLRYLYSTYEEIVNLDAKQIHTVNVARNSIAAWLVYEGKEDPNYKSICYSNVDLTKFDDSNLYKPMTEERLSYLLGLLNS